MPSIIELTDAVKGGALDRKFSEIYPGRVEQGKNRLLEAIHTFAELFPEASDCSLFSTPGRTEVGGNHTDHQKGCVLAASLDLDIIAVVSKNDEGIIRVQSAGYDMDVVDLSNLTPVREEREHSPALVRGICARFKELGYQIGGFDAYTISNVLKGSGMSSSAAYEVMICTILSHLYNEGKVSAVESAKIAQYSENVFFGKPCGLMDQMACAVGGFVSIDFKDPKEPVIGKVDFDFVKSGYCLCIVDTGGCHADLTDEYAAVPEEMKNVAQYFGKDCLRELDKDLFYRNLGELRGKMSDRAILRAMHFFADNQTSLDEAEALRRGDMEEFKRLIIRSGNSSFMYLQNVFSKKSTDEQGLSLALAISQRILEGEGAWRVHGGGFAGTIQAFVPRALLETYIAEIEAVFGEGSCNVLNIRPDGGIRLI